MIKFKDILNEGGHLFGGVSERISTEEMNEIFSYLKERLSKYFVQMNLSKSLPTKEDHGDIDIIVELKPLQKGISSIHDILKKEIPNELLDFSKNAQVHSMLFKYKNKKIQVDFLVARDGRHFDSMSQYYTFNDVSGIIGIFSKKINFSYGQQGFSKIYKDKRNNAHYIFITSHLKDGMKILGLDPNKFDQIRTKEDMVPFILDSPLMDKKYFEPKEMNQSDRKSEKRPVIAYVVGELRKSNKTSSISDEDYFFKKLFPKKYERVELKKQEIEEKTYMPSKYNGEWLMKTFNLKPGKEIGQILKHLSDEFKEKLETANEQDVMDSVIKFTGGIKK